MAGKRKYIGLIQLVFIAPIILLGIQCKNSSTKKDQSIVLHFTATEGWDHKTREVSRKMFEDLSESIDFELIHSNDSKIFDDNSILKSVDVIVFSNTSGEELLSSVQQKNFQNYIEDGGNFIGIHSASDTHRTNWEFYSLLVGAIVQIDPWHTASDYVRDMKHRSMHQLLEGIPNPWQKEEEYYYWDLNGGRIDTNHISVLLDVESTGVEVYDRKRPTTWFQKLPNGTKSFYTSLGHSKWNYEISENSFRKLIANALLWTLDSN